MSLNNPYAEYTRLVYGDLFVGRQDTIRVIQQRIINADNPGNLSIVGVPKIGKSSLAYHTLIHPQSNLIRKKLLTFRISLPSIYDREQLFREFVSKTVGVLTEFDKMDEKLFHDAEILRERQLPWAEFQENVCNFFRRVKRLKWRVVAVLDEFDSARTLFQGDEKTFQALRGLADDPDFQICLVTLSRRPLSEISRQLNADVSIFPGNIFKEEYLRHFESLELKELLQKMHKSPSIVSETDFDFFLHQTGGHPYLASTFAFDLFEQWIESGNADMIEAFRNSELIFFDYYDYLIRILQEDNSLGTLLQFLSGSQLTSTSDVNRLSRYGLIQKNKQSYRVFSNHFEQYLTKHNSNITYLNSPEHNTQDSSKGLPERTKIFVSYSRFDKKWRESLAKHMGPLLRKNQNLDLWDDTKIKTGEKWREEIEKALAEAKVAILLITPDFLNTSFILDKELPFLLKKAERQGLTIFWIPIKSSSVAETEINEYQSAHNPTIPLAEVPAIKRDLAWVEICNKIKDVLP